MPSTIAIVSILIARKIKEIFPLWNKSLEKLTSEEFEGEIQKAYAVGLSFYIKHFGFKDEIAKSPELFTSPRTKTASE